MTLLSLICLEMQLKSNRLNDLWIAILNWNVSLLNKLKLLGFRKPHVQFSKSSSTKSIPSLMNSIFSMATFITWTKLVFRSALLKQRVLSSIELKIFDIQLTLADKSGFQQSNVFLWTAPLSYPWLFLKAKHYRVDGSPVQYQKIDFFPAIRKAEPVMHMAKSGW